MPAEHGSDSKHARGNVLSLIALVCSALTSVVLVAFFAIGLADGSVSSFNMALWLVLLAVAGASVWAGHLLRSRNRFLAATAALSITAVPGLLAGFFLLLVLVTQPRWN
jgi:hypothetical protein